MNRFALALVTASVFFLLMCALDPVSAALAATLVFSGLADPTQVQA